MFKVFRKFAKPLQRGDRWRPGRQTVQINLQGNRPPIGSNSMRSCSGIFPVQISNLVATFVPRGKYLQKEEAPSAELGNDLQIGLHSDRFSFLQPLRQGSQICCRYFHRLEGSRRGIEHTLLLNVRFPRATRMPQRVTSRIPEGGFPAGFDALAGHVSGQSSARRSDGQWFPVSFPV